MMTWRRERSSSAQRDKSLEDNLCVYRHDPFFRFAARRNLSTPALFAIYIMILLGLKVVLTAAFGTLVSADLLQTTAQDADQLFFVGWGRAVVKSVASLVPDSWGNSVWSHLSSSVGRAFPDSSPAEPAPIPLMRDYVDILIMFLLAGHMALLHPFWKKLSELPEALFSRGLIDQKAFPEGAYLRLVRECDAKINSRSNTIGPMIFGIAISAILYTAISVRGIYPGLSPDGSAVEEWQSAALAGWWGYPGSWLLPFIYQAIIIAIMAYYIARHNVIGVYVVKFLWALKKHADSNNGRVFEIDPTNNDRYGGLLPIRNVLKLVFASILIMGLALALLIAYVPNGLTIVLTPLVGIFLLCNPYYVYGPLRYFHKVLSVEKAAYLESHRKQLTEANRQVQLVDQAELHKVSKKGRHKTRAFDEQTLAERLARDRREVIKERLEDAEEMKTSLFSMSRATINLAMYGVPVAAFVAQVVTSF